MNLTHLTSQRTRQAAASLAVSWGYPREISWLEVQHARWYSTQDGIGWLIEGGPVGHWHLHGIGRPGAVGVLQARWTALVLAEAKRLGAVRVYAPILNASAPLERLLRRAGWDKRDDLGPFLEVS